MAILRDWIAGASGSFRRRLDFEWEDLQQELLIEVIEELDGGRYEGTGPLRGFVSRSVAHSCIDRIRYRNRWRLEPVEVLEQRASAERTPEVFLTLRTIAERMPRECQELWRMILEGLSYREMSERTGVRAGTLRVRVNRCRERASEMRRELEMVAPDAREAEVTS